MSDWGVGIKERYPKEKEVATKQCLGCETQVPIENYISDYCGRCIADMRDRFVDRIRACHMDKDRKVGLTASLYKIKIWTAYMVERVDANIRAFEIRKAPSEEVVKMEDKKVERKKPQLAPKECPECGVIFTPTGSRQEYCSPECRRVALKAKGKQQVTKVPPAETPHFETPPPQ